jgi:hypothetical protein
VFGGFLSWILSAGAARADEREKKPASPPQDAHGLPLAPRHVVVIPADRFRCVNVGVGSTPAPPATPPQTVILETT